MNTTTTATTFASRTVERVVRGQAASDGDGVKLTRVLTEPLQKRLDPFLMLDAFGSDSASDYVGGFPDHPHRGFETVTIMLEGRMRHRDSVGNVGLLEPGSVQWMTAGRGIIHSEMPEQKEGRMAGFQLWVNLAAADKMTAPAYRDVAPDAPDGRARPDREHGCPGQRQLRGRDQPRVRRGPIDQRDRRRKIAVDGVGADHERSRSEPTTARDADVEHGDRRAKRKRAGRCSCGLDRPDSADEPIATVELALGRSHEEDTGHGPILRASTRVSHSRRAHNRLTGAPQRRRV